MCGIAGIISINNDAKFVKKNIFKINNSLKHRGPDDKGIWVNKKSTVALGHNRLSIQDLSKRGYQPMISRNKNYVLVFNGEIYNHLSLRKKVSIKWKGNSDSETLIQLLEKFGIDKTLSLLSGMFAFALWDIKKEELIIARDLYGEKPVYFGLFDQNLIFASELDSFLALGPQNFFLNKDAVLELLRRSFIPAPLSILKNVYKLKPGFYLKINKKKFKKNINFKSPGKKFFKKLKIVNWKKNIKIKNKYTNVEKQIELLIEKSVKDQLISDVPVGCLLSGGIDSSLVSFYASKHSKKKLKTFSISVNDYQYNESQYSKIVSKKIQSKHYLKKFSAKDMIKSVKNVIDVYSEPFADSSQLPTILLSKYARSKVKVVLTGDGGDELFGGYNRYYKLNKIWKYSCFFPRSFTKFIFLNIYKIPNSIFEKLFAFINNFDFFKKRLVQPMTKFQKISFAFSQSDNLKQFFDNVTQENWINEKIFKYSNVKKNVLTNKKFLSLKNKKEQKFDIYNLINLDRPISLSDDMLCKIDRASMHYGLEARVPLLDKKLTYYVNNLPKKFDFLKTNKFILKNLLDLKIFKGFSKRPKMGFSIPLDKWLRKDLKRYMLTELSKQNVEKYNLLKWEILDKKIKEHLENKKNNERFLWSVIILHLWLKKYKVKINE